MTRAGPNDPMRNYFAEMDRDPTEEESDAVEEVRAIALEWAAGRGSLAEVRRATSGRQRFLATRFTPPSHEAFRPLMNLLDALIADQGAIPTKHGIVDAALLAETGGLLERTTGTIRFPVAYQGGRAVFRSKEQRGPTVKPFTTTPQPDDREQEFWEKPR